jgi:ribonuclease E
MTRRMLINARSPEEIRLSIVSDKKLDDYQLEVADHNLIRGNIYRGTIASIQPSLNAAFIDYGGERHGFLSVRDIMQDAWYKQPEDPRRPRIDEVLERGKPIVVQVARESEGTKGAVLTTDLSLAGRYLVFTPFNDTRGVSRKVDDDDTRRPLKDMAAGLDVPGGGGVIVRTNAVGQTKAVLQRDLASLLRLWKQISLEARQSKGTKLLYSDQDLIFRALRDYVDTSIREILVDDDDAYAKADEHLKSFMPRSRPSLIRYEERVPLFSKFGVEEQVANIYERQVPLPSGGSIVVDRTEALTAIDVNSGKATSAGSQEETALQTNLEAAVEVARQLRLRDIGGLVVVDFIDMRATKSQRKVEKALRDAMKDDKARATVGRISPNGLLEVNRQRLRQALSVRTHKPCPTCTGTGRIPSPEMVGLNLLRQIEARAAAGAPGTVRVELHPEYADAIQNSRRREIAALENELEVRVEIIASPSLHRSEHVISWIHPRNAEPSGERPVARPVVRPAQLDSKDDDSKGSDGGEGGGKGGSRKRRGRGGRGPKGKGGGQKASGGDGDGHGDGNGDGGKSDDGGSGRKRRGRGRRGGRGRGKSGGQGQQSEAQGAGE